MPDRPYYAEPNFVRKMEAYNRALDAVQERLAAYDAMIVVGGSGPMLDMVNNQRVHDVILGFYRMGKPIAAECYGVATLAFAREVEHRQSIIRGKQVTGHCLEYDYKDGTGFEGHHASTAAKGFRQRLHRLRAALLSAGVHPSRRDRARTASTSATSATRPRSSWTTRSSPGVRLLIPTSRGRRWSRCSSTV